jgi:hypothetical protein
VSASTLPAYEQSTKAIVPRVGSLDDPSSGLSADNTKQGLLAASSDVGTDTAQSNRGRDVRVVVALVEAQVLGAAWATRAANRHSVEDFADHGSVRHVRTADQRGDRHAAPVGQNVALYAAFRSVRRVRPREVPPFGAFTEALSRELHFQEIPRRSS